MIKLIIFDLWNTLAYKNKTGMSKYIWKRCCKNHTYRKVLKTYENIFQLDRSTNFEKKYSDMFKELKVNVNETLIKKFALRRKKTESNYRFYFYSIPLLRKLKKKGYKTAVLSNTTGVAGPAIRKSKLSKYIDRFFFSYDLGSIKPDPRNFKAVLKYFKAKPSEALMIGNTYEDDVLPARKLGIKAIHFKNGKLKKELKRMGVL
jgi:HAD superfamily hydrolase (TIGR01509 family)